MSRIVAGWLQGGAPASAPLLLVVAVAASGCYRSHERGPRADAGPTRADAGPRRIDAGRDAGRDAGPDRGDAATRGGSYWTLEAREAQVSFPHDLGCTQLEGGSLAIRVTATIESECEHGGPVEVTEREDGTFVARALVWVEHPPPPRECLGITDQMERTVLRPARAGIARVEDALGSSRAEIVVPANDGGPCAALAERGAACRRDCDSRDGLLCVPDLGDFAECFGGRCGDPCNALGSAVAPVYPRDLDCPETHACAPGGGASSTCVPEPELCDADADCGDGLACPVADRMDCRWEVVLSGLTRHACEGDLDCDRGMHCVEHPGGRRTCDVPCFTDEMRCPPMHACNPYAGWICEWIGE